MNAMTTPRTLGTIPAAWRKTTWALGLIILALLLAYHTTVMGLVEIWSRSDTFTHGFLVMPISLWLVWRQRSELLQLTPRPALWLLPLGLPLGFAWLLADLAAVNVVAQFAWVGLLILGVVIVLGLDVARRLTFPLAFLLFAVPFGEFALPQMMEWTANFTVQALRLTGVPVYREGLSFVIPSGHWSVVEACSGIRYLIASTVVGTLYAYLNYRSWRRRVIFVVLAFLVPIVANWLRAYLIVMLGHVSGNKLAAGVDHLIYGWVFFGIVIMAMFWIGARWREDDLPQANNLSVHEVSTTAQSPENSRPYLALVMLLLLLGIWPLWQLQLEHESPASSMTIEAPAGSGWIVANSVTGSFVDWQPEMANPDARLQMTYQATGKIDAVGLDISWYRQQNQEHKLVTSVNSLASPQNPYWKKLDTQTLTTLLAPLAAVNETRLVNADGRYLLLWSWYWVDGQPVLSPAHAVLRTALTRLLGKRDDAALVVIFSAYDAGHEDKARQQLQSFLQAQVRAIDAALQRTRAQ